jgi:TIR domain
MFWTRYDVFLSYSRADSGRVQPLRDELCRLGYSVFYDVQSIDPGEQWKRRLERSVRASRILVLCWSEHTRGSDYITFEYSRAEALHKPILPWLLDKTPLPAMLEIQGITNPDAIQVASALRPKLGWTLGRRRKFQLGIGVLMSAALAIGLWLGLRPPHPPPPWEFQGEITDRNTRMPISGVEVDIKTDQGAMYLTHTDSQGKYDLRLPRPQPKTILILFRKDGYEGDQAMVSTNKPFNTDMARLH